MFHPLINDYQKVVFELLHHHLKNNLDYSVTEPSKIDRLLTQFKTKALELVDKKELYKSRILVSLFSDCWKSLNDVDGDVVLRSSRYTVDDYVKDTLSKYEVESDTVRILVSSTILAIKEVIHPPEWNIIVLDVETGGLPSYDYKMETRGSLHYPLLQVSMQIFDKDLQPKADMVDVIIHQPESELEKIGDYVTKMHTNNGLLEKVRNSTISLEQAEKTLLTYLEKHGVKKHSLKHNRYTIIAGNSIYTDKEWLNTKMSYLDKYFSYQLLDFSAFQLMNKMSGFPIYTPIKKYNHLANDDIIESVEEGRRFLEVFWQLFDKGGFMSEIDCKQFNIDSDGTV